MGSNASKVGEVPHDELSEGSVPSTPILTPKTFQIQELDPRSPSTIFSRTPIDLLSTLKDKLQNETTLSDSPVTSKNDNFLLGIDPRSPTTDFTRTPILISNEETSLPKKLHNKNLDKVRRSVIAVTPVKANDDDVRKSGVTPPKLLESHPIQPKPDANKRKSFVGLLETNIDYTETDLDEVIHEKSFGKSMSDICTPKTHISVVKNEDVDPRSPTTDFLRTPIQVAKKIGEIDLNANNEEASSLSESEIIQQTVINNKPVIDTEVNDVEEIIKEIIEGELDDKFISLIAAIAAEQSEEKLEVEDKSEQKPKQQPLEYSSHLTDIRNPSIINITADVRDFDKKLSNLIYEDKTEVVSPKVSKTQKSNRTPLAPRNTTTEPRRSIQKLKVSDRPRKLEKGGSKIPLYREKHEAKSGVQCENTPPRNMQKRPRSKPRKPEWDSDNTLVI